MNNGGDMHMNWWRILLIILFTIVTIIIVLVILRKKLQKNQKAQQEQIETAKQVMTMLIINKKKLRLKDSGLPQIIIEQTPKLLRRTKLPIVKAKVGPKIMTFIADTSVSELIPFNNEIKATVSGLYIIGAKGIRGPLEQSHQKSSFNKLFRKNTQRD